MQRIIAMQHCLAKNALANRGSLTDLWCRIAKPSLLSDNILFLSSIVHPWAYLANYISRENRKSNILCLHPGGYKGSTHARTGSEEMTRNIRWIL
jgi:hypothetical protein